MTGTPSEKGHHMSSQFKERNIQDPMPKESPKSWFFDNRSKSLPVPPPISHFDNSGLGLCPGRYVYWLLRNAGITGGTSLYYVTPQGR